MLFLAHLNLHLCVSVLQPDIILGCLLLRPSDGNVGGVNLIITFLRVIRLIADAVSL